jgi:hypothetical protein
MHANAPDSPRSVAQDPGPRQGTQPTSRRLFAVTGLVVVALATAATGCASVPVKRPGEPLVAGEPAWPEDVTRVAERVDRRCGARETQLLFDYHEAKGEKERFKTILGTITGGVSTVGGAISGVGAYTIKSPDTAKTVSGVSGIVTGALGAVGSVLTVVISPGAAQMASSSQALTSIDEKRAAAREAIKKKDPNLWSSEEKEAWLKSAKELEATCK